MAICPGLGLAMLHHFVANLMREFGWKPVEGEEVDLSKKPEFIVVMKVLSGFAYFHEGRCSGLAMKHDN